MPEPLKNMYNPRFFESFTDLLRKIVPGFRAQPFLNQVFDTQWGDKELKQRVRHIATMLELHLPGTFRQQTALILDLIAQLKKNGVAGGFEYMIFPDFIEQYGQHDLRASLKAMEAVTPFISCEFAVRPFLLQHPEAVMSQMLKWSCHAHANVRRFSSEGCRPRLPWAMAIPQLKKDPSPIMPILENLRNDGSLFVRKSVANNLNDIARDHPDTVLALVNRWKGESAETDWIIRHGCRTLLKKAHPAAYKLFGLDSAGSCQVYNLRLSSTRLRIGERLAFSFDLTTPKKPSRLRLEYVIYYNKAGGQQSRKIFQLSEKTFAPSTTFSIKKEQRFQDFTTRKHYPGKHRIAIVVNGKELAEKEFMLER